ncbi:MAG: carboxymuconolactone decarboxylase family protein [Acidimicrobiales bacterium]
MEARIQNPALTIPGLFDTLQALGAATEVEGLPKEIRELVALRASQINGCSVCLDMHSRGAMKNGASDERLFTLAAWRETPYFSDAERAALALTEAATRLSDRADPVPDDVWNDAAKNFDEPALAALVVTIAAINLWNRLNIATGQLAGPWTAQWA